MKKYQLKVLNEIVKFIKKKSAFELCDKHESLNNFETIFKIYSKMIRKNFNSTIKSSKKTIKYKFKKFNL